ncbi:MAG TPA: hypothetical protein VK789_12380 [Bryobacteraceae bacterium]|jgi:hypothetical protein|nr:hypothetical protein [Bryobacteraceae bacterium]
MSEDPKAKAGWWSTLPGVLTAVAGLITAVAGLIVALHQVGVAVKPQAGEAHTAKKEDSISRSRNKEIKVGAGEIVYKVLGTRIDHQAEGRRSLRVRIGITCNQSFPCYFGASDFRLVLDGEQRAPISGPNEAVPSNSTQEGIATFAIPAAAERAEFVVVNHGDPYKVPIDLKR